MKKNDGEAEFKNDIFDIRTFVNATMYPTLHNNNNKLFKHQEL
jgi:hypothetical protein